MIEHGEWTHDGKRFNVAFADGQLFIERQDKPNLVGGIARGKVDRIVGNAAFVKLPGGAMGYLEKAKGLKPGAEALVQVSAYATGGKAWPLSTELKLQGRRYIYLPRGKGIGASKRLQLDTARQLTDELALDYGGDLPGGWIIRSGASFAAWSDRGENAAEAKALAAQAAALDAIGTGWLIAPPSVLDRARLAARNPTTHALDRDMLAERMQGLLRLDIDIDSGGRLRLGPTPALLTIDIDSGSSKSAADGLALEITHAIRSRGIAGQIVVDPLRDSSRNLLSELKLQAEIDHNLQLTVYSLTKMGLIELSRPRLGPNLYEALDD